MKIITFFFLLYILANVSHSSDETTAEELYYGCAKYVSWIDDKFKEPVDEKTLFIMGKCQGVIESVGKTMFTMCLERKKNLNIPNLITANVGNIKASKLAREFLIKARDNKRLSSTSAYTFLLHTFSKRWPCN